VKANPAPRCWSGWWAVEQQLRRRQLRGSRGLPGRRRAAGGDQLRQHDQEGVGDPPRARGRRDAVRVRFAEELEKLAKHAPGARVYCRILVETKAPTGRCRASSAPRSRNARELMLRAGEMGLDPYGLSFHVGSQQTTTARL
jgi:hypothetical protein